MKFVAPKSVPRGLLNGLLVFMVPVLEIFLARGVTHYVLGPNNFSIGFYVRDVAFPLLFGVLLFFVLLEKEKSLKLRAQPKIWAINLAALVICCLSLLLFDQTTTAMGGRLSSLLFLLPLAATVGSAFLVWIAPKEISTRLKKREHAPALLAIALVSLFVYQPILENDYIWGPLSEATGYVTAGVLNLIGLPTSYANEAHGITLRSKAFDAYIGVSCSGVEGMSYFIFIFALILMWEPKKRVRWGQWAIVALCGLFYMFLLNVTRITVFFRAADYMTLTYGKKFAVQTFIDLFHSNIGWMIYMGGITCFLILWSLVEAKLAGSRRS